MFQRFVQIWDDELWTEISEVDAFYNGVIRTFKELQNIWSIWVKDDIGRSWVICTPSKG